MGISKLSVVDRIEVLERGHIQVRVATRIIEDGVTLSESFHRSVLAPGDPLPDTTDPTVVAIARAVWTDEKVAAWTACAATLRQERAADAASGEPS